MAGRTHEILTTSILILITLTLHGCHSNERTKRATTCSISCSNVKSRPVCGINKEGKSHTFTSKCEVRRRSQCGSKKWRIDRKGPCSGEAKCLKERKRAMKIAKSGQPIHIPECQKDGSYAKVQCTPLIHTCWCVEEDGKPESGTSVKVKPGDKKPTCKSKPSKRRSGNKKRRGCKKQDQAKFNKNLISVFSQEYARVPKPISTKSQSRGNGLPIKAGADAILDTLEKRVIAWKFSELDKNKDNILKLSETRPLQKMVRKLVRPKSCARHFIRNCDRNRDKAVSRSEWSVCLGNSTPVIRPVQTQRGPSLLSRQSMMIRDNSHQPKPQKDDESKKIKSCAEERSWAMEQNKMNNKMKMFVPVCTSTGQFEKAQCHTHTGKPICWCVEQHQGKPIPGTLVQSGQRPKCDSTKPRKKNKNLKGCPGQKKNAFLTALLDHMTTEMVEYANSNSTDKSKLPAPSPDDSFEERVVTWKLNILDRNKNGMLEKRELREFKKELRKNKTLKRCGRNFIRYCDTDGNKKVTLTELKDCMGLNDSKKEATSPKGFPKPKGRNPFKYILTR